MNGGHSPAEGETQVEAELTRLKTELVSDADLEKAKNQILRDFILSRQTAQTRAEELGYAAVVLKDPELVNTELQRFLDVTPRGHPARGPEVFCAGEQDGGGGLSQEGCAGPSGTEKGELRVNFHFSL